MFFDIVCIKVPDLVDFDEEETKTKFTNYSMSSSIIRRNKELSLLDDKFDRQGIMTRGDVLYRRDITNKD